MVFFLFARYDLMKLYREVWSKNLVGLKGGGEGEIWIVEYLAPDKRWGTWWNTHKKNHKNSSKKSQKNHTKKKPKNAPENPP